MAQQAGGAGGSYVNRGQQASQDRYAAQAKAAADAAARARAIAAGRGNPSAAQQVVQSATPMTEDTGSYGGGGGGYSAMATAAPAITPPSLEDYVKNDYLVSQQDQENQRTLSDFDMQTTRDRSLVQLDQQGRLKTLEGQLNEAGTNSAGDLASRGLLRSGFTAQAQDRINQEGVKQRQSVADLLTNFTSGRQTARLDQEAKNRAALAEARQNSINGYYQRYFQGTGA